MNRSTTEGGLENEIREVKALLGQLAADYNLQEVFPANF